MWARQRLHQLQLAAGRGVHAGNVAVEVCQVALEVSVAPHADQAVHAVLIDHARIGLQIGAGRQGDAVEHGVVLEPLRAEGADAAAVEEVVDQERGLTQAAAVLELVEVQVFEAGESAGLQVAPAVDQTEIELAFVGVPGL